MNKRRAQQVDRNLDRAYELIRDVMRHPERYPEDLVAIPLDPDLIAGIFTDQRIRLLREARRNGPYESVEELARALHRDPTRVGRDLAYLEGGGFIKRVRVGKKKRIIAPRRLVMLV